MLFSAPMVRALLAGTKTQTRRAAKLPHMNPLGKWEPFLFGGPDGGRTKDGKTIPARMTLAHSRTGEIIGCPLAAPGDRLWVRESFAIVPRTAYRCSEGVQQTLRPDDDHDAALYREGWTRSRSGFSWRPSIHMPRWASRILLDVTGVRVERLQDISEADCWAEGIAETDGLFTTTQHIDMANRIGCCIDDAKPSYALLWESINGPGSWDLSPFVWAVEFKRITP
jgi:hypothetical protein